MSKSRVHPALTDHASLRSVERGSLAGIDMAPVVRLAVAFAAKHSSTDIAVRLYRHHSDVGDTSGSFDSRDSNGSDFWAVARGGSVTTFFWRRSSQPVTPDRFDCSKVFASGWKGC